MLELMAMHLRNTGYAVTVAEDAAVAGRQIMRDCPDLLVLDVEMPYINGLEFAAIMMADATVPSIPIVLISAHERYRESAERLGVEFLRKPFLKIHLLAAVSRSLAARGRRTRQSESSPSRSNAWQSDATPEAPAI
jgi:DNA-binding response OmpR family regulator